MAGVKLLWRHGFRALLADAMGLGKTIQALWCLRRWPSRLRPALVICPNSVVLNWKAEAQKWIPRIKIHVIHTSEGQILPPGRTPDLVIVGWDMLRLVEPDLRRAGFKTVIADECHYAKNPEAQRSQALARLCKVIPHRLLLSGTPVVNNADELRVLSRYITGTNTCPIIRRLLEDVAKDIPAKRRVYVPVELPYRFQREYEMMMEEEGFGKWLKSHLKLQLGDEIDADLRVQDLKSAEGLVKVGYLRRLVGEGKTHAVVKIATEAVNAGEPIVVFAEHQDVLDGISNGLRRARIKHARIDGSVGKKRRQAAVDDFQAGLVPVVIASKAAKEGVTLTRARHMIFAERWWTPADEEQAEDRIRRIGQRFETTIWYLTAQDTYDESIRDIVERKRAIVANTIGSHKIEEADFEKVKDTFSRGQLSQTQMKAMRSGDVPGMPANRNVYALLFDARKWRMGDAERWMQMKGYKPGEVGMDSRGRVRAQFVHRREFLAGTFQVVHLSRDIAAIIGTRKRRSRMARKCRKWTLRL